MFFYFEYNSTINCSLIFSGICALSGIDTNAPSILSLFQDIHSYTDELLDNAFSIEDIVLDFSRTPITSPALIILEGILQSTPSTVMCL